MDDTSPLTFNPFTDRLSRDLRNDLSEGLLAALTDNNASHFLTVANRYRQRQELGPERGAYLSERLACYLAVLAASTQGAADKDRIALLLWDHELFFEFHELLEQRWLAAKGEEKLILQALIRAAGMYVHRQFGRYNGAIKMASRARETLSRFEAAVPLGFTVDKLIWLLMKLSQSYRNMRKTGVE